MPDTISPPAQTISPSRTSIVRITSIDILRALTMLLMIFVNDLWTLTDIPVWLEHTAANTDGMGLADTVFPAFLVLVGMSIPFSVSNRINKGENNFTISRHIVVRSFALIVMGIFLVNGETLNQQASGIPEYVYDPVCSLSFILLWMTYPKKFSPVFKTILKVLAVLALVLLAWFFRGGEAGTQRFGPGWYGILGLIGWAYLASALCFTLFRKLPYLVIFWLVSLAYNMTTQAHLIPRHSMIRIFTSPFGDLSMPALVMAGVISSVIFLRWRKEEKPYQFIRILLPCSAILILAGFYFRQFWGISKIHATPAWVLICSGITIAAFVFIYWLTDIRKKSQWFRIIKPAGTNTLLVYLLPYFAYPVLDALHFFSVTSIAHGMIGLLKSLVFALLIVNLGGLLEKWGIRMKL